MCLEGQAMAMAMPVPMNFTFFSSSSTSIKNEILSLSSLPISRSSSSSRWKSVALSTRSTDGSVEFGQTTRRRISRDVQVFGRRGRVGGRPTKPARDGISSRGHSGSVQQQQEFQAKETKQHEEDEDDVLAEEALEALFAQLEKDLEDGAMSENDDDNEDFTEEEVMALEDELEAALLGLEYSQQTTTAGKNDGGASTTKRFTQEDDELLLDAEEQDEEEQRVVNLETWQLKKLAAAAEIGRRHVNVKALAADLGMDRSDVLAWLKNPPPELLTLGVTMGLEGESEDADQEDEEFGVAAARNSFKDFGSLTNQNSESQGLAPVTWHNQKRLRKEHIATFERVFRRTRRPTNAMIQNLVELTHVPRKRIVEWFNQKRQEVDPSQSFESLR